MKEGKVPKVAQGAGTACWYMRGTVPPGHVALSQDTWLLVWVRPWGPSSTISERRSWLKMARADTFCSQGSGNLLCAWQVREQLQVFGHELHLDAHTALVRAIIHHSSGSHFAWPGWLHCMSFLFARTLHLPARTLPSFVCFPTCLCWQIPRACESVWCLRGPLERKYPALVCVGLPCACSCTLSPLVDILNCSHDHWGGTPPLTESDLCHNVYWCTYNPTHVFRLLHIYIFISHLPPPSRTLLVASKYTYISQYILLPLLYEPLVPLCFVLRVNSCVCVSKHVYTFPSSSIFIHTYHHLHMNSLCSVLCVSPSFCFFFLFLPIS